jgi:hypothetical protein
MLAGIRYFLSDVAHWLSSHRWAATGILVAVLTAGGVAAYLATSGGDGNQGAGVGPAPAPRIVVKNVPAPDNTDDLGFPAFATKNTTRVAGSSPIVDAAAVALAVFPSTGGLPGPDAVTLVDAGDWQAAIAAASLVGGPVGAPLLITEAGELSTLTAAAIRELAPKGSAATAGRQVFVVGGAAVPDGYETLTIDGADAAELASGIDRLRDRLAGEPDHIVLTSSDAPPYAMPAAGWAARSGDPVLFVHKDSVPDATVEALRRHDGVPVFVLGPTSVVGDKTMKEIRHIAPSAERVGAEGPVENAIAFARYVNGSFGWNINDPGHGFVLANTDRPLDAAVASPLSASGTWGPVLVTDDGATLPASLHGYLLDLKPGYADDPTRAVYNHAWLIGDTSALSVDLQAEVDDLAEVAPVTSGSGSTLGPAPGTPESQPQPNSGQPK